MNILLCAVNTNCQTFTELYLFETFSLNILSKFLFRRWCIKNQDARVTLRRDIHHKKYRKNLNTSYYWLRNKGFHILWYHNFHKNFLNEIIYDAVLRRNRKIWIFTISQYFSVFATKWLQWLNFAKKWQTLYPASDRPIFLFVY